MHDGGVISERSPAGGAQHPTFVYCLKVPAGDELVTTAIVSQATDLDE